MKIEILFNLEITEKRLLKLGFSKSTEPFTKGSHVYVIGSIMNDCGNYSPQITYDPDNKVIYEDGGGNVTYISPNRVNSMDDIKRFLKNTTIRHEKPLEHDKSVYEVILLNPGMKRLETIKTLKTLLDIDLKTAKELCDSAPVSLGKFSRNTAIINKTNLEKTGANIKLR